MTREIKSIEGKYITGYIRSEMTNISEDVMKLAWMFSSKEKQELLTKAMNGIQEFMNTPHGNTFYKDHKIANDLIMNTLAVGLEIELYDHKDFIIETGLCIYYELEDGTRGDKIFLFDHGRKQ